MFDLENLDIYVPNTKVMRDLLKSLNYKLKPLSDRGHRKPTKYRAICFAEWIVHFGRVQQTNKMYYCMNAPTLTEDQSIFVFDILHVCPDYQTFKEALEQYVNSNP